MPAEWTPHARCWMQWPDRREFIWPNLERTQDAYARVAHAVRRFEPVTMIVSESSLGEAEELCGESIDYLVMELDDAWARDSGPSFVKRRDELAASVFQFGAWGGKYPRVRHDAAIGHRIAEHLGIPTFTSSLFMEGGAISVDGEGTILTTESCVLNRNRNLGISKAEAERELCDALGGEKIIWLPGDPRDVETDGHVDGVACFVRPGVVLCAIGAEEYPDRHRELRENVSALERATDAQGRALEVLFIEEAFDAETTGERFSRSFVNFYIANGGVVSPRFCTETDERALQTLQRAFPERSVVQVDVRDIVVGGGGIHCITQQQPL